MSGKPGVFALSLVWNSLPKLALRDGTEDSVCPPHFAPFPSDIYFTGHNKKHGSSASHWPHYGIFFTLGLLLSEAFSQKCSHARCQSLLSALQPLQQVFFICLTFSHWMFYSSPLLPLSCRPQGDLWQYSWGKHPFIPFSELPPWCAFAVSLLLTSNNTRWALLRPLVGAFLPLLFHWPMTILGESFFLSLNHLQTNV